MTERSSRHRGRRVHTVTGPRIGRPLRERAGRGGIVAVVVLLVAGLLTFTNGAASAADPSAVLTIDKTASVAEAVPGQQFTYTVEATCSSTNNGCVNAAVTDAQIPAPLQVVATPTTVAGSGAYTVDWDGKGPQPTADSKKLTVRFADPITAHAPSKGLNAGVKATVQFQVKVPDDLDKSYDGRTVTNRGDSAADNANPVNDSVGVTLSVPDKLAATTGKTWNPGSQLYQPGATSTVTLTGANTSNVGVDALTVVDPVDPTVPGNPFDVTDFSGFGALTFPGGADRVQVDAFTGAGWVNGTPAPAPALPGGVTAGQVRGLRFTFSAAAGGTLTAGGQAASISFDVAQRATDRIGGAGLSGGGTITDASRATVRVGSESADSGPARATLVITPFTPVVAAGKSFDPADVPAGSTSTATLTGTNKSPGALQTLTVTEPAGTFFDGTKLIFSGFTAAAFPTGATSASVRWLPGGQQAGPVAGGADLVALTPPAGTTGFAITFTGSIAPGATATVAAAVQVAVAASSGDRVAYPNTVDVDGTSYAGPASRATATATLTVHKPTIGVNLGKVIVPTPVGQGHRLTVQLTATTTDQAGAVRPTDIVVTDPQGYPSEFGNAFDLSSIAGTAVPAGSTLTVEYTTDSGGSWHALGAPVTGPATYSNPLNPAPVPLTTVTGIRFTFHDAAGFAPSTSVRPNVVFRARSTKRDGSGPTATSASGPTDFRNCGSTVASNGDLTATANACVTATVLPPVQGTGPGISKTFDPDAVVVSRSGDRVGGLIDWNVLQDGRSRVEVADTTTAHPQSVPDSFYQAFDLTRIAGISPDFAGPGHSPLQTVIGDPLMRWDAVSKVELKVGASWVDITAEACPTAQVCQGKFPGYDLTPAEQAVAIGVRLTFVENPDRAAQEAAHPDPSAPDVGSGVATGLHRPVYLIFRVRDTVRVSQPGRPDLVTGGRLYNVPGQPGDVDNTASATAYFDGTSAAAEATDDQVIVDRPLTVKANKTITPGALTVPQAGTAAAAYPTTTWALSARNTSPSKVDELIVTDGAARPGGTLPYSSGNPFEDFDLTALSFSVPAGTGVDPDTSTVYLIELVNGTPTRVGPLTLAAAAATADFSGVVGLEIDYRGRIGTWTGGPSTDIVASLTTRLRATHRSTGTAVGAADSPVRNTETVTLVDVQLLPGQSVTDTSTAQVTLAQGVLTAQSGKTFDPGSLDQPAAATTPVQVTLSGRSTGSFPPVTETITDTSATFWNVFELSALGPVTLPDGADRVEVDVQVNGSTTWQNGTAAATAALPTGVTPSGITGIRFVFTRADGAAFDGTAPATAVLVTHVRSVLRDGSGPVPTTADTKAAPNETTPGVTTNLVGVDLTNRTLTAHSQTTAQFTLNQGTIRIAVQKISPVESSAGALVTFQLVFRNTGTGYIPDPVIVDTLPADGTLVYDPTAAAAYETSTGGTLPTDDADITETWAAATRTVTFTFAPGVRMSPGEEFRVLLPLQVKPGLTSGTEVVNAFGVGSPRPFSACTRNVTGAGGQADVVFDQAHNTCSTTATLHTDNTGGLVAAKGVKGAFPGGGADNVLTPGATCKPDASGFYRYPCVARTVVGGVDTWDLQVANGSATPADRLRLVDVLPRPGDHGLIDPQPRGSTWRPAFRGNVQLITGAAAAGATVTTLVTTAAQPCLADIAQGNQPAVCPPGSWVDPATVDPTEVTGLEFVFDFSKVAGGALPAGGQVDVHFDTINLPHRVTGDERAPIDAAGTAAARAWNSFAVNGTFVESSDVGRKPAEPNKAGVELVSGALLITKVRTGDGAAFAPTSFTAAVSCLVAGTAVPLAGGGQVTLDAAHSYAATVTDIPFGSTCTVAEAGPAGGYGETTRTVSPTAVTITSVTVPAALTITNTFPLAGLTVVKTVATDATVGSFGPFGITVTCSLRGRPITFADHRLSFTVTGGRSHTVTGLPVGASCTVAETDAGGASATTLVPADGTVVIPVGGATVGVRNTFAAGRLAVRKVVTGTFSSADAAGPFILDVECSRGAQRVWSDARIPIRGGQTILLDPVLPAGTVCAVTETDHGNAISVTVSPDVVVIAAGATATVTVTNTFPTIVVSSTSSTISSTTGTTGTTLTTVITVYPPPPAPPAPPPLAYTGVAVGQELGWALVFLLVGGSALLIGRRRRRTGQHR